MNLSHVKECGVGKLKNRLFIVSSRWPDNRVSGGTEVTYEDGSHQTFTWDHQDPEIVYLGDGKVKVSIEFKGAQQK